LLAEYGRRPDRADHDLDSIVSPASSNSIISMPISCHLPISAARLSLTGLFSGSCDFDSAGHSNRYTMKDDDENPSVTRQK
jgi:hypothetical protein